MKERTQFFLIWIFFMMLFVVQSRAQHVFNRAYDFNHNADGAISVTPTFDGGYIFTGDGTFSTLYICKTDSIGDTLFTKSYNLSIGGDIGSAIIQLQDSNFVICGSTKEKDSIGAPTAVFLMKIDKNGDSLWLKRYGGQQNDYGHDVKQTADGGFIIAANTYSFSNGNMDALLIKTDSVGKEEWKKNYGGFGYDNVSEVLITKEGGFLFVGGSGTYSPNGLWLFKTNNVGDSLWQKTYGTVPYAESVESMKQTSDGGFILAGYLSDGSVNDAYIAKVDSACNMEWEKVFLNELSESSNLFAVSQTPNNNYFSAGDAYNSPSPDNLEGILMKVNSNGDSVWLNFYTRFGQALSGNWNDDYIDDMKPTSDGGFIMCGMVTNYGSATGQDMWLVKTDSCGYTVGNSPLPQMGLEVDSINGLTVYFKNTTTNACAYLWRFGDGATSTEFNPAHTYGTSGLKTISLYAYAGDMGDTVSLQIFLQPVGVHEIFSPNPETDFRVFSDISNSVIRIKINSFEKYSPENLQFELFDVTGRRIKAVPLPKSQVILETKTLNPGMYFYKISGGLGEIKTGKIIIY